MSVHYFEQTMALLTHGPYKYDYAVPYGVLNNIKRGKIMHS